MATETETQSRQHLYREGKVAKTIEQQTAKLPSDLFLWAAGGSIIASLVLKSQKRDTDALFIGQWAPTFLLLGIYNKLVKLHGSD
ncbi:hypothetical protein [Pedosphaera parvula]|uniref:Uncharacterized protein n=1 Tax=Pedosphaera parvula (strain Ellin514) TaxID=320771 RepID=B9XDR9_PEDPL|nr:hypothetical protein [Pedosphaera parvula]EEF62215.1 conserved hypothetical protein [Pedosphaera parvula Ellin514]